MRHIATSDVLQLLDLMCFKLHPEGSSELEPEITTKGIIDDIARGIRKKLGKVQLEI